MLHAACTAPDIIQTAKGELEDQMSAVRSQLDAMKDTETSLQVGRHEALARMGHGHAEGGERHSGHRRFSASNCWRHFILPSSAEHCRAAASRG